MKRINYYATADEKICAFHDYCHRSLYAYQAGAEGHDACFMCARTDGPTVMGQTLCMNAWLHSNVDATDGRRRRDERAGMDATAEGAARISKGKGE